MIATCAASPVSTIFLSCPFSLSKRTKTQNPIDSQENCAYHKDRNCACAQTKEQLIMIFDKLAALIAEQFNVDADTITMETSFADDLNADSVDIVDLSMALEEEFGIEELGEEEASSISTVGDLVRFLQAKID